MDNLQTKLEEKITKPIMSTANPKRLIAGVAVVAVALGALTGYILSTKDGTKVSSLSAGAAKSAQQDTRTFRDFAQGTLKAKPQSSNNGENTKGTHLLIRESAVPVALTSSVLDLSQYENKKVKVFGETQAVPGVEWFMDVGKIEEVQ